MEHHGRHWVFDWTAQTYFQIITHIFLGEVKEDAHVMENLEKEFTALNYGLRAMPINLPGFGFYTALKVT